MKRYSRVLSFLLALVLVLTLTDPAAHAEGLPGGAYIPAGEGIVDDTPADDSEFNRWVEDGAKDEEIYNYDPSLKYADNVYNIEYGITVGNNRYHKGYYYNGLIYCPVYPEGKPPILWKNSFICDGCTESIIIPTIEWLP